MADGEEAATEYAIGWEPQPGPQYEEDRQTRNGSCRCAASETAPRCR